MSDSIKIWDDDGPDGSTACLDISAGGNGDWYVHIIGEDWAGDRLVSDGFRASTSGPKCGAVTTCIALLAAIGRGNREHAMALAKGLVTDLERGWSRLPNEDERARAKVMREASSMVNVMRELLHIRCVMGKETPRDVIQAANFAEVNSAIGRIISHAEVLENIE